MSVPGTPASRRLDHSRCHEQAGWKPALPGCALSLLFLIPNFIFPANVWRMDSLLKLIRENAAWKPADLAAMLNLSEGEVTARIRKYEAEHVILGYRAILDEEKLGLDSVRAVIEVKITPERGGGFDRLAGRIAKYSEVQSCYLMSGGYDLLVVVQGSNLREVATFVSEKLATVQGVISTATHFMLKPYKEQGVLMKVEHNEERLAVTP